MAAAIFGRAAREGIAVRRKTGLLRPGSGERVVNFQRCEIHGIKSIVQSATRRLRCGTEKRHRDVQLSLSDDARAVVVVDTWARIVEVEIARDISAIALCESRNELRGRVVSQSSASLHFEGRNPFVIGRDQQVVVRERRRVNGEPTQRADDPVFSLELEKGHLLVGVVEVARALRLWVLGVGDGRAIGASCFDFALTEQDSPRLQAFVRRLDGVGDSLHDRIEIRLTERTVMGVPGRARVGMGCAQHDVIERIEVAVLRLQVVDDREPDLV